MNWLDQKRMTVFGGLGVLIVLVCVYLLFDNLVERRRRLQRTLDSKSLILTQMHQLKSQYETTMAAAASYRAQIANREREFTLFSFLDRLAGQAGIKNSISYMKPSTSELEGSDLTIESVEMKFQAVTLKQITTYLHLVETSPKGALVRRLSMSRVGKEKFYLDVVLLVETLVS
jgi:general secretion pathway protein M